MTKTVTDSVTTILLVDDHPAVREALANRIAQHRDLRVCGEADNVVDALQIVEDQKPDIIITDISLKASDGIDLIKRIKTHNDNVQILVWSMHSENLYAERALRAGAMGYITKAQDTQQIIEAIRQVLAGKMYLSPAMSDKLLRRSVDSGKDFGESPINRLTDRELEVLRLIGEGVKTCDVAERLHLSIKTVETHRDRIKKKLDLKDSTELMRRAVLWVNENH